jgi:hypothetical protein
MLFVVASLQLLVPGAAAWADAEVEARGSVAPVHIESHSTSSCARVHPPDCGLCRFLSVPLNSQPPRQIRLALVADHIPGSPERVITRSLRRRTQPQPRAPPSLLVSRASARRSHT